MIPKTSAVIFDMDGLMFDTESAYSVIHTAMSTKRGKVFTDEVKTTLMGKRAHEVMGLLNVFWDRNEDIEALLAEQDQELIRVYGDSVGKLEGLDDLIAFLNKHSIRKCIGTSSRRFLVDVLLDKYGLSHEFEFVVSGDMVTKGKPDPEIYQKCLAQLGLSGSECLVLEDSSNGIKAGIAAGCKTCAIPSAYTMYDDFTLADLVAHSLDDDVIKKFILA